MDVVFCFLSLPDSPRFVQLPPLSHSPCDSSHPSSLFPRSLLRKKKGKKKKPTEAGAPKLQEPLSSLGRSRREPLPTQLPGFLLLDRGLPPPSPDPTSHRALQSSHCPFPQLHGRAAEHPPDLGAPWDPCTPNLAGMLGWISRTSAPAGFEHQSPRRAVATVW